MRAIVEFFLRRHLLVHVLLAATVTAGYIASQKNQREGFPVIELNQLWVNAVLPGAAAEDVEKKLTLPIEEAIDRVDGVQGYRTTITENMQITIVDLDMALDSEGIDLAKQDIEDAIAAIRNFPAEMTDDPMVGKIIPGKLPILEIALSGPTESVRSDALKLERLIKRVEGVGDVTIVGYRDPEVRIFYDPERGRALGVTIQEVIAAIESRNIFSTGGKIAEGTSEKQVVLRGLYEDPSAIELTPLRARPDGGVLRLGDVARVEQGLAENGLRVRTNGKPGISIAIRKKDNADIIDTVDEIVDVVGGYEFSPQVKSVFVNDLSFLTRNRLQIMVNNGLIGIALVILTLFIFLNRQAAIWVSIGVPVVIAGTVALLPFFGLTVNMITMAGFVVVLGLLVDDAVVVAERIIFRKDQGLSGVEAAREGTLDVIRPVIASSITTVLAFSPMLFLGGPAGKFAWAVPAVVVLSLIMSIFESVVMLPLHLSNDRKTAKPAQGQKRAFVVKMEHAYRRFLEKVMNRRYLVVLGFIIAFIIVMGGIAPRVPFTLFPQDDSDVLWIKVRMPEGTSLEETEAAMAAIDQQVAPIVGSDLIATTSRVGHLSVLDLDRNNGTTDNIGFISAIMKPVDREKTCSEWSEVLTDKLRVPLGATMTFEAKPIGPPVGFPVQIHVASNDDLERRSTAQLISMELAKVEGLTDVNIDEKPGIRQIDLNPDYDKMAMYGISPKTVGQTLKAALYGVEVSEMRTLDETMKFRVMFDQRTRTDLDGLLDAPILTQSRQTVSLRDVVRPVDVASISSIYHRDGVRTATVTANFIPGAEWTSLSFARFAQKEIIPSFRTSDISVYVGGEAVETEKATGDLAVVGFIAVVSICTVIAVMLNSFVEAVFVVCVIPFGIMGVFVAFWVHGATLSLFAMLGGIGLSGVVVNDSVVMVDGIHRILEKAGEFTDAKRRELVIEAVSQRLRPILVTTTTTLGGVLPTAYGLGGHDMALSPMSLALGWGLFLATALTLILVPALYEIAQDIKGIKIGRKVVVATALVVGFGPQAFGDSVIKRSELPELIKSRTTIAGMLAAQAEMDAMQGREVGSILLPSLALEGSSGWERSSVLNGVDVSGNPMTGDITPEFDVDEVVVRADRVALIAQWNFSAEVLSKWLALREVTQATILDGVSEEEELEVGLASMMTRYVMLRDMAEVARKKEASHARSSRIMKEKVEAGAALQIDALRVETVLLETKALLVGFERDAAVLKAEVCRFLKLDNCDATRFEIDERVLSTDVVPTVPPMGTIESRNASVQASVRKIEAAEYQKLSEVLGWVPNIGVQGSISKQRFSEESPFLPPEDGWSVGVGLSWELWDGGQRLSRLGRTEAQRRIAELGLQRVRDDLSVQVLKRRESIKKSQDEYKLSSERVKLMRQAETLTQNAYQEGGASLEDLLDTQDRLLDAELGLIKSETELDLAWKSWSQIVD